MWGGRLVRAGLPGPGMGVKVTLYTGIFASFLIGAWFPKSGLQDRNVHERTQFCLARHS